MVNLQVPDRIGRVFVSSTWLDLQPEQKAIERVLQRMRETKFVGMEYFGSQAETTREASLGTVDRCRLYIGVIAGRYGSGITEAEYRRARACGLPCFIYIKDDSAIPPQQREPDAGKADRLAEFKKELRSHHLVSIFSSADDLAYRVATDLHNWLFESYVTRGIRSVAADYAPRIQNFLVEYLGSLDRLVPFGGRQSDLKRLNGWLNDSAGPHYLFLAAPAGSGKSALLARWSRQVSARDDLELVFFPVSIRFRTNLAAVVFQSLASRLAELHHEELPTLQTPAETWRGMVSGYLSRRLPDGRKLLMILDGVDEAADWQAGADLFPFVPPERLRVVLSARYMAGDRDASAWLHRLGWDQPGLAASMSLGMLTEDGVAEVLRSSAGKIEPSLEDVDFCAELYRLTEGDPLMVQLYVGDIERRSEEGESVRIDELQSVEPKLEGFFARWWEDQRRVWGDHAPLRERSVQALLNVLACALGPLSESDILAVAPPEAQLTHWTFQEALRPLSRFVVGDGEVQGYAFGHPRLNWFFYEELGKHEIERKAVESRFLEWGEQTVTALDAKQLMPSETSPYLVQYYGPHLDRANAAIEALGALAGSGWQRAWFALEGSYSGFLNDIERLWRRTQQADLAGAEIREKAKWAGLTVRCALCKSSVGSLAANIPVRLPRLLVDAGLWSSTQALAYARQVPGRSRFGVLANLSGALPPAGRDKAHAEALDGAIAAVKDDVASYRMLTRLAPNLPAELRAEVFAAVRAIRDEGWRAHALADLVPDLVGALQLEALGDARKMLEPLHRAEVLVALGACLPDPSGREVMEAAHGEVWSLPATRERGQVLAAVTPHLPEILQEAVVEAVRSTRFMDPSDRARNLARMARDLSDPTRTELLLEALGEARFARSAGETAWEQAAIAPHLPEPTRTEVLSEALETARRESERDRCRLLTRLAPNLRGSLMAEALADARAIQEGVNRAESLAALAPHIDANLRAKILEEALEASQRIDDQDAQHDLLAGLAPFLPEAQATEALRSLLKVATAMRSESKKARVLNRISACLPQTLQAEALEVARQLTLGYKRADALTSLGAHLSAPLRLEILDEARTAARTWQGLHAVEAIVKLIPHLPEAARSSAGQEAVDLAKAIRNEVEEDRTVALAMVAEYLPESTRRGLLTAVADIRSEWWRGTALEALIPHLPQSLADDVLLIARSIVEEGRRAQTLGAVVSWLPESEREGLIDEILEIARGAKYEKTRAEVLSEVTLCVATSLKTRSLIEALKAARGIERTVTRAYLLSRLAPQLAELPLSELQVLWADTLRISAGRDRANLLSDLAALAPVVWAIGGTETVVQTQRAMQETVSLWP